MVLRVLVIVQGVEAAWRGRILAPYYGQWCAIACAGGSGWYWWIGSARAADHKSADVINGSFIFCSSNKQARNDGGRGKLGAGGRVFI